MSRFLFLLILTCTGLQATAQGDAVEGYWYTNERDAKLQIYKATDGTIWGKVAWLKVPDRDGKPKTDARNENPVLRNRPVLGMAVLSGFKKDGETGYTNGKIYDPKNGKTYSCNMELTDASHLSVRGYIGISLLGRTAVFIRASD